MSHDGLLSRSSRKGLACSASAGIVSHHLTVEPHERMVCIIYPYMEHQMSDNIGLSAFVCRTQANPGLSCVYLADHLIAGASRRSFPRGPSRNVPGQVISLDSMQDRKPSSCRRLQPWFVFRWFLPAPCHVATCRPAIRFNLRTSRVRVGVTTPSPWPVYVRLHQSASTGVGALMMS
jgi:hypothetical protein